MEVNQTPPVKEEIPALVKPEKGWYAIYTHSRAEKRVSDRLKETASRHSFLYRKPCASGPTAKSLLRGRL